jgi:Concanavalin A-like lectin/glucanases superfamily/Glycosyl hydrolases family 2/Glycosyl hydrolases family 2, TIM barrel domain/Glycosyl hydrolase 2 galactose-binding domain-like
MRLNYYYLLILLITGLSFGCVRNDKSSKNNIEKPLRYKICLNGPQWQIKSTGKKAKEFKLVFTPPKGLGGNLESFLVFDSINWSAEIFLNGKSLGTYQSSFLQHKINTRGLLKKGVANTLFVKVQYNPPEDRTYFTQGYRWGNSIVGILGDVYLEYHPKIYVSETFVRTSFRKKHLDVSIKIKNTSGQVKKLTMRQTVYLETNKVLELPDKSINIKPQQTLDLENGKAWKNPKLWGYGKYGSPTLYFLETSIWQGKKCVDRHFTRFGFREIWIKGKDFYLNGHKLFTSFGLLGPVCGNHRSYITKLYQAFRSVNINAVRYNMENAANSSTPFDVADELGFFIKPMMFYTGTGNIFKGHTHVMTAEELKEMKLIQQEFVRRYRNHPALLWWVVDNENGSTEKTWNQIFELCRAVKKLDTTRPIENGGDPMLLLARADGRYPEMAMFSARPVIKTLKIYISENKYDHSIPLMNDEIYLPPVFVDDGTSIEYYQAYNKIVSREINSLGQRIHHEILAHRKELGAASLGVCVGLGVYFNGMDENGKTDFAWGATRDGMRVSVPWPSRSGRDKKTTSVTVGSDRCVPNWFDSHQPVVKHGIVGKQVKSAYAEIYGKDLPDFKRQRPEVILTLSNKQGSPLKGTIVLLQPCSGQPIATDGVMTDNQGTAWFTPEQAGTFKVRWFNNNAWHHKIIEVENQPFDKRPGYQNIQWFDLGSKKISKGIRKKLAQPAKLVIPERITGPKPNPRKFNKRSVVHLPIKGQNLKDNSPKPAKAHFINGQWQNNLAYFNGKNTFIQIDPNDKFSTDESQEFSVSLWFKRADQSPGVLLLKRDGGAMPNYMISINKKSRLDFGMRLGGVYSSTPGQSFLKPKPWHHLVCTFNSSEAKIYIDGKLDMVHWKSGKLKHSPYNPVWLGRPHNKSWSWFKGFLDNLRMYNYALTTAEVKKLFKEKHQK